MSSHASTFIANGVPELHPDIPHSVYANLDVNRTGLDVPADRLRRHLKIPDITTRSGLRKVHADFNKFNKRLDACYATAAMLVCVIWTKMSADVLVREQLLRAGLIPKLVPLLGIPPAGGLVEELFRYLIYRTNQNGQDYALEIARNNPAIIRILREHPNDGQVVDYTITTFAYAILPLISSQSDSNVIDDVSLIPVLSAILDTLRNPDILLEETLRAALTLLGQAPPLCPKQSHLKDVPSLLPYYAALSRSSHVGARSNGIAALLGLGRVELRQASVQGEHPPFVTHSGHIHGREYASQEALLSKLPDDLQSLMVEYGVDDCEYVAESRASCNAGRALSRYNTDEDACAFGRRVAELLQLTEYPINPTTTLDPDAVDDSDIKALDILSMCASSLAFDESPGEQDAANIIELHYLLVANRDLERAQHRAQLTVQHNPNLAYGYYAMSLAAPDAVSRYRAIQKGLVCKGPGLTPFLRRQLLSRAVLVAGEHAISLLRDVGKAQPNVDVPRLAKAYCKEAINAAKLFIEVAPPDARQLPEVLSWYIVLKIVVEGPGLRDDMSEYEPLLEKLATAERFTDVLHPNSDKTDIQYAREWLFEHYQSGSVRQWERLIVRLGEIAEGQAAANSEPQPAASRTFSEVTANRVRLDECAWCENSTVVVRKCSHCGQVRYCSKSCQKLHWPLHKESCRASTST